jgi:energy-coupling factor transporter transmembrane protein EcfT
MNDSFLIALIILGILAYFFLIRIYIAYRMAKNRYRDPLGWVLLSLFFSPLFTWIVLLIVGDDKNAIPTEDYSRRKDDEDRYISSRYDDVTH